MQKKVILFSLSLIVLNACSSFRNEVGLTAKTYNGFTKEDAEKVNYVFDANRITYKDKNGNNVVLTQEEKQKVVDNVNQCLIESGYATDPKKTRTILLNLDFTESEEKNKELYYDYELARRYPAYDYTIEGNIGPNSRVIATGLFQTSGVRITIFGRRLNPGVENVSSVLLNYLSNDKVYYVSNPYYSKFLGLQTQLGWKRIRGVKCIKDDVVDYYYNGCNAGVVDVSNFYAKLTGKEENMTKFETVLHYMSTFVEEKNKKSHREFVLERFSKNICMFIADNANDLGINIANTGNRFDEPEWIVLRYQKLKNKMNNAVANVYDILLKDTGQDVSSNLYYGDRLGSYFVGSEGRRINNISFYAMKHKPNELIFRNNLVYAEDGDNK